MYEILHKINDFVFNLTIIAGIAVRIIYGDNMAAGQKEFKVDIVDNRILSELTENPSIQIKDLARKIGIHSNTLLTRLRRLERSKIILKYAPVIDYARLGYSIRVIIFLKVETKAGWEEAIRALADTEQLVSMTFLTGEYDCVMEVLLHDRDSLGRILRMIQATNVVSKTTSFFAVEEVKKPHEFNPLKNGAWTS